MRRIKDRHLNLVWVLTKGGGPAELCLLAIGLDQVGLGEVGSWVGDAVARVRHVHQQGGGAKGLLLRCHHDPKKVETFKAVRSWNFQVTRSRS